MQVNSTEINGFLIDQFNQHNLDVGKTQGICPLCSSDRQPKNQKAKWNDSKMFNLTKQPFSMETLPILSNSISNAAASMLGLSKKALVIDLDNTIWGGIIGDDGLDKILLGPETPLGEAFQNFQK